MCKLCKRSTQVVVMVGGIGGVVYPCVNGVNGVSIWFTFVVGVYQAVGKSINENTS